MPLLLFPVFSAIVVFAIVYNATLFLVREGHLANAILSAFLLALYTFLAIIFFCKFRNEPLFEPTTRVSTSEVVVAV